MQTDYSGVAVTIISDEGYLQRQTTGTPCKQNVKGKVQAKIYRDWWFVKANKNRGYVTFKSVIFPEQYVGKKVRFKVEIMEDIVQEELTDGS